MGSYNQSFYLPFPNSTQPLNDSVIENDSWVQNDSMGLRFEAGSMEMDEIIVCCVINFLIETFGNGLLVLMIINERYLIREAGLSGFIGYPINGDPIDLSR